MNIENVDETTALFNALITITKILNSNMNFIPNILDHAKGFITADHLKYYTFTKPVSQVAIGTATRGFSKKISEILKIVFLCHENLPTYLAFFRKADVRQEIILRTGFRELKNCHSK